MIDNAPKNWEVIQLAVTTDVFHLNVLKNTRNNYARYIIGYASMVCYAINKKGAAKILKFAKPTNHAEKALYYSAKTYTYKYPMFTYPTENDSLVHPSHLDSHVSSKRRITNYLKYN